jgi:hypothetical protein
MFQLPLDFNDGAFVEQSLHAGTQAAKALQSPKTCWAAPSKITLSFSDFTMQCDSFNGDLPSDLPNIDVSK